MQKYLEISNNPINSARLPEDSSQFFKLPIPCKLVPGKSLSTLSLSKPAHSVTRKSEISSKQIEKQAYSSRKSHFIKKPSFPKLPPLQSNLSRSIKRICQFTMPTAPLIEEFLQIQAKVPSFLHCSQTAISLEKPRGYENKKTLILDLDETLIHAEEDSTDCHITLKVGKKAIGVNIRPFAQDLLKFASSEFEVIIFTASSKKYADCIIDHLDPQGLWVHHRLYREHCSEFQGNFLKSIERIADRNLKDVVIVDNCLVSFCMQTANGVPISTWFNDLHDVQLKILMDYLKILVDVNDVRVVNQMFFSFKPLNIKSNCDN